LICASGIRLIRVALLRTAGLTRPAATIELFTA
jgi:hypothetical protein